MLIFLFTGGYLWKEQKETVKVISVVVPKEYEEQQQEWIKGIKASSSDFGFLVNFFFEENEQERRTRIEKEKLYHAEILTEKELDKDGKDFFVQGYEAAEKLAKTAKKADKKQVKKRLKVGIALYSQEDFFINTLCEKIEGILEKTGEEKQIEVITAVEDAAGNPQEQNRQIEFLMDQECDILALNLVDTWSASQIIDRARERNIPLIFFNREPSDEDIQLWKDVYYIGTDGEEIGKLQGEILTDAFCTAESKIDKNQDGILQYISVEGEEGHCDSVKRTAAMLKKTEEIFSSKQVESVSADWNREMAKESFIQLPIEKIESCEAVICNNDDMALGVLDALKERKIEYIPAIVGVNGEQEVLEKIQQGEILGTVSQKSQEQAKKVTELIWQFWEKKVPKEAQKIYLQGEKYQNIP